MQLQVEVFRGERLALARDFVGLTQKELGVQVAASSALISICEAGKKPNLASDLVAAFADVLGFEPDFFYEKTTDPFLEEECSFRHRRSTPQKLKAQVRAHGTLLGMVIDELRSHFDFPAQNIPQIRITSHEDIERAAEAAREHWSLGTGPIKQVVRVLEHAGILVARNLVCSSKVDAFSRNGEICIIFLNDAIRSSSRWNFDLAHECGHLVMHSGLQTGDISTEAQADRFASAFLMPRNAFSREFSAASFSWRYIFDMKSRWQTSAAAIVRRAFDLNLIGAAQYRRAYQYMSLKGWSKGEPVEPSFQEPELLGTALSALGVDVDLSPRELCSKLHFSSETFEKVTGYVYPKAQARTRPNNLLVMSETLKLGT